MFWFLALTHASAAVALVLAELAPVWRFVLLLGVVASFARSRAIHWHRTAPRAIRSFVWQTDGRWRLRDGRGETIGKLDHFYLGTRLIILNFSGHPAVLIRSGCEPSSQLRQLRVRLRHGQAREAHPRSESPQRRRGLSDTA
jgi:hypothetical protein